MVAKLQHSDQRIFYQEIDNLDSIFFVDKHASLSPRRFYTSEQLSEHMAETPEGFLICYDVPITRMGEFVYKSSEVPIKGSRDGLVKIRRDEEEVFSDQAIMSFEGKPVTINHPSDFVTPDNWKKLTHGQIQNVRRGEGEKSDLLIADICLMTSDAINLVKSGLRQVSCGYDAEYEQVSDGVGRQSGIIGNHLALVVRGRAGNRCAIMDADNNLVKEEVREMKPKTLLKKLFPRLNTDSIRDEDLEMAPEESLEGGGSEVDEAKNFAQQAKESATQAVQAAKEAAEAVQKLANGETSGEVPKEKKITKGEGEKIPDEDPMVPEKNEGEDFDEDEEESFGDESSLEERFSRIESGIEEIKSMIAKLKGSEDSDLDDEDDEEFEDQDLDDEDEEEFEDQEIDDPEDFEEVEDELDLPENKNKFSQAQVVKDAVWQDTISKAEILYPGIAVKKPKAGITKKELDKVKKRALSSAMSTKDSASLIKPLLKGKKISNLSRNALDSVFVASSHLVAKRNNGLLQKKTITQVKDFSCHKTLASMNAANKEFWKKKNH